MISFGNTKKVIISILYKYIHIEWKTIGRKILFLSHHHFYIKMDDVAYTNEITI